MTCLVHKPGSLDWRDYERLGHSALYSARLEPGPVRKSYAQTAINFFTTAMSKGAPDLGLYVSAAQELTYD